MAEDKKLTQLVINELTKAQYEALGDNVNEDEIYVITDDEVEVKSDGTTIVGNGTTANPLSISPEFIEKVDTEISNREEAISSLEQSITNTINELDKKLTESDTNLQEQITANTSDLSSHASNTSNPHGVTKAQVGLGNVDNTSDANKPISTATQSALDDLSEQISTNAEGIAEQGEKITSLETNKANVTDLTSHTGNKSNPHGVTAAQVGLGNVDNTSDANKPISTATQAALDLKANASDLASHTSNTSNPHSVTKAQVGLGNVDNTADLDKPISTKTQAALNDKADKSDTYTKAEVDAKVSSVYRFKGTVAAETNLPTSDNITGDVYNVEDTGANYAWDGTAWDKLSETVDLTPYLTKEDAAKTYETIENANLHKNNTSNPHNVTKAQVGLGNVDNTSDANKPISTATQTALDKKQDTLTAGTNITITGATISAKDTTYTAGDGISITDGVISNTRVSVEWSNVTGDITEQEDLQNALNLKADKSDTYTKSEVDGAIKTVDDKVQKNTEDIDTLNTNKANASDLSSHTSNTSNPHSVTKAQVGLGNVDNTSDSSKPVSTLQQAALDLKADKATTYTKTEVDGKIKAVDDKAEKNSEDIVAQGNLITNLESNKASVSDLTTHTSNTSNPHNVTAAQVGLGNVDNTSDADKPISTATQSALDEKQDTLTAGTNITITGTTISAKDTTYTAGDGISITDGVISNTRVSAEWGNVTGDITAQEDLQNALTLKANQSTTYTKTEVDNKVKTVDDKVANNTQEIATIKNSKADSSDLSSHTSNTSNPHEVTAAQIGLGNVDNTSDADKPISTATQTALDLKADKSTTYTKSQTDAAIKVVSDKVTTNTASITSLNQSVEALQGSKADATDLSSHTSNVSNPHNVTAEQVGLGNVDNTSDADKPISTATQTALNAKADKNNTYTKAEVDAKVSSVYRFIGSVASVDKLPATATVGDTYNVEDTGANYAWTGSAWDKLSETIDLTPYLTKSEASTTYETIENVGLHTGNKNNPHGVTKAQVGLGNVDNTSDLAKPISTATQNALNNKADKSTTYTKTEVDGKIKAVSDKVDKNTEDIATHDESITTLETSKANASDLTSHTSNTSNPHSVTKAQVGLGNVDNTSDANKPISTATQAALDLKANITDIIKDVQNISSTNIYNSIDDLPELDASKNGTRYLTLTNGALPLVIYSWTYNTKTWDKIDQCRGSTVYINIETGKAYYYRSSAPYLRQFVSASEWGSITGTLSNQTDLNTALGNKADKSTTYTKTETDNLLAKKLDTTTADSTYATKTELQNLDVLPAQTGNSGKYLTTNGTEALWASFPPVATLKQW